MLVEAFHHFGIRSLIKEPIPLITGTSQFAIFYLMAQLVERIVEPFSNIPKIFSASKKKSSHERSEEEKGKDDPQQWARTVQLWCFASILGIILCYFTIGLFQMVGVEFMVGGHAADAALSGLIVGGGTKPLHDVIGYLQDKNP